MAGRFIIPGRLARVVYHLAPAIVLLLLLAMAPQARAQVYPDLAAQNITFTPTSLFLGTNYTTYTRNIDYPTNQTVAFFNNYQEPYFYLAFDIANLGTDASTSCTTRIWASVDGTFTGSGNDILLTQISTPGLLMGAKDVHAFSNGTYVRIDPNFIGLMKDQYLNPGTYNIAIQVDAGGNNTESDENNFFVCPTQLRLEAKVPWSMGSFQIPKTTKLVKTGSTPPYVYKTAIGTYEGGSSMPPVGYDLASVSRVLEWTSAPYANRYDLYFGKMKDLDINFIPRVLPDTGTECSKVIVTDMGGPAEDQVAGLVCNFRLPYKTSIANTINVTYKDATPDLLVTQNNKLLLYMSKNQGDPITNIPEILPQYYDPLTLLATTPAGGYSTYRYGSNKYGEGIISAVVPGNVDYFYRNQKDENALWWNGFNDVVCAEYFSTWEGAYLHTDDKWYFSHDKKRYEGQVYVILNRTSSTLYSYTAPTFTPPQRPPELITEVIPLWNHRKWLSGQDEIRPMGIKALALGDVDNDNDNDIIVGSDRLWDGAISDKVCIFQSSYVNDPEEDPGIYPPPTPTFRPWTVADNQKIEDAHALSMGDFNKDGKIDIALASFHGHECWVLENNTDTGGNEDSTRTLKFNSIGPLLAYDVNGTTVPLYGASTICSADLNNDRKPDLIAGGYFAGQIVVYESTGSGNLSAQDFKIHMLSYDLMQNVEKVVAADMNGDGLLDVVASSATNDRIAWWENLGSFRFLMHIATENDKANHVGYIDVADLNNDLCPDIISISQIGDAANPPMRWYANFPKMSSRELVARNLKEPVYDLSQHYWFNNYRMDFNSIYGFQIVSHASDAYQSTCDYKFFRTQPTRIKYSATLRPFNEIEPGGGAMITGNYVVDGPLECDDMRAITYCDPILDRRFYYNAINPFYTWGMKTFGYYLFNQGYNSGWSSNNPNYPDMDMTFDGSNVPEGLYNYWIYLAGITPTILDGTRDGVFDGVADGYDGWGPMGRMNQIYTAYPFPLYGDDCFLAQEKMAVVLKPGLPLDLNPVNDAQNVPTSQKFSWTTTNYTTGYDLMLSKAAASAPIYTSTTISASVPIAKSLEIGDLSSDGKMDFLTSSKNGTAGQIYWHQNRGGGGGFYNYPIITNLKSAPDATIVNMDPERDARLDVLEASNGDNLIQWHRNLGGATPSFAPPTIVSNTAFSVKSARGANINGDVDAGGKPLIDVVAAMDSDSNRLCWFERSATGVSYTKHIIDKANTSGLPQLAIPFDVDSDGDLDVLVAAASPSSIAWYENSGGKGLTWYRHLIDTSLNTPQWLAMGDFNNDSAPDIVCVANNRIVWFQNNRAIVPAFTLRDVATGLAGTKALALTDYNHDAKLDIISSDLSAGKYRLLFFENLGGTPPTFRMRVVNTLSTEIRAVAGGDIDGDTFNEIAAADLQRATWYDFIVNFRFGGMMAASNTSLLSTTLPGVSTYQVGSTNYIKVPPPALDPSSGYLWQVVAKRIIPVYGGTYERITSSTINKFNTSQSDLVAVDVKPEDVVPVRTWVMGKNIKFSVYEKNIGLCDAAPHQSEVWASPDPIFTRTGNDILLGIVDWTFALPPGTGTFEQPLTVNTLHVGPYPYRNWNLLPGIYYIGLFTNTNNGDNSESNKDNNKVVSSGRITITKPNASDLWGIYD